jgi:hypothetical protein
MSNFPILDLVAGIVFVYFLLSIISSSAVEMIQTGAKLRSKMLEKWLKQIFTQQVPKSDSSGTEPMGIAIINHCALNGLSGSGKSNAYLSPANFTAALLEKLTFDPQKPNEVAKNITDYITAITNTSSLPPDLKRVILNYAYDAQNAIGTATTATISAVDLFKGKIENWFDSNMDRVGGYMKIKYTRPITFIVAAITVLALNADSISIAKYLYNNPGARAKIAGEAYAAAHNDTFQLQVDHLRQSQHQDTKKDTAAITLQQLTDSLNEKWRQINTAKAALEDDGIPLGWSRNQRPNKKGSAYSLFLLSRIAGLLATFFAIVMGAPFWFDVLNKISNLRGTGTTPRNGKSKKK